MFKESKWETIQGCIGEFIWGSFQLFIAGFVLALWICLFVFLYGCIF